MFKLSPDSSSETQRLFQRRRCSDRLSIQRPDARGPRSWASPRIPSPPTARFVPGAHEGGYEGASGGSSTSFMDAVGACAGASASTMGSWRARNDHLPHIPVGPTCEALLKIQRC